METAVGLMAASRPFRREADPSSWRRLAAAGWRRPDDPSVYATIEVDAGEALELIERLRRDEGVRVTLTHLVAKALAMALAAYPKANGLVLGSQVYLRHEVDIFCQVSRDDDSDLSGVKLPSADRMSLAAIAEELGQRARRVRAGEDAEVEQTKSALSRVPGWLLRPALRSFAFLTYELGLDLSRFGIAYDSFGSAMVSSVGSVDSGITCAHAPLLPLSRCPIVVLVPRVVNRPVAVGEAVQVRPTLQLGCTFDHRLLDGMLGAKVAAALRENLENARECLAPTSTPGEGA
jgi:pyruvate dehydrogenase E2 component (dihydrolipoamide acetyltransferase)